MRDNVSLLVSEFVEKIIAVVEDEALARAKESIVRGLDGFTPARRGANSRARVSAHAGPVSAARKRQGQYLGRLKRLRGRDRQRVQALARERGVGEAIKLADRRART